MRHAPAPLQVPSLPHEAAPASVHWLSGSVPEGTNLHVPRLPASAHDWQVPVHAVRQQKPWLQFPLTHSAAEPQAVPEGFLPQAPPLHVFGLTQSALEPHVARHALAPHT